MPFRQATADQRQQAEDALARLRAQADKAMTSEGVTDDELDRALLENE